MDRLLKRIYGSEFQTLNLAECLRTITYALDELTNYYYSLNQQLMRTNEMIKREPRRTKTSYQQVVQTAIEAFGYDKDKALTWYMTKKKEYGDKSPFELCKEGHTASILKELNKTLLVQ